MQGKIYEIPLDISSGVLTQQIREVVTEDMGTNTFKFKLVKDKHIPYDLSGTIVRMMVKTPSGARIQQECTIENAESGTVSLTLKQSLILERGSHIAELQICDEITQSIRLTTPTFDYHVRQSLQNSESIVATDEYTILQEALADLAGINIVVANKVDKSEVGDLEDLETEDKINIVTAINEVKSQSNENASQIAKVTYDNAGAHNSIFRGKYLGASVTAEQYANIQNGTFKDLYIGDYWTIGGINWRIAAFNYYRNTGDSLVPGNHITIVSDTQLYTHHMNPTAITTGGYTGSDMYINGLEQAKATIRGIFGNHLIKHRQLLSNAAVDGKASGWAWVDSEVDLMTEPMVYGSIVWGESTIGGSGYNIGVGKSQLPLFALNPQSINTRQNYWLRDVVTAADFARVYRNGDANSTSASLANGVRPAFSIS